MADPLTRKLLDAAGCQEPGCKCPDADGLFLRSRCHPMAGVIAKYEKASGVLTLTCAMCTRHIADVAVAAGDCISRLCND